VKLVRVAFLLLYNEGICFSVNEAVSLTPFSNLHSLCFQISVDNIKSGRVHTLITSAFSHINSGHIISNMIGLYFFGNNVRYWPLEFCSHSELYIMSHIMLHYVVKLHIWLLNAPSARSLPHPVKN